MLQIQVQIQVLAFDSVVNTPAVQPTAAIVSGDAETGAEQCEDCRDAAGAVHAIAATMAFPQAVVERHTPIIPKIEKTVEVRQWKFSEQVMDVPVVMKDRCVRLCCNDKYQATTGGEDREGLTGPVKRTMDAFDSDVQ